MVSLPKYGTHIDDILCKKCGKKLKDFSRKKCDDPLCPHIVSSEKKEGIVKKISKILRMKK